MGNTRENPDRIKERSKFSKPPIKKTLQQEAEEFVSKKETEETKKDDLTVLLRGILLAGIISTGQLNTRQIRSAKEALEVADEYLKLLK